jgi:hypothetical protein
MACTSKIIEDEIHFTDNVSPVLRDERIWCNTGINETGDAFLFFLEATATDPQGEFDLHDGEWKAIVKGDDQVLVEDELYWEDGKYVYSFHSEQHPLIECVNIDNFRFVARALDWSGNISAEIELENMGFMAADSQ